MIAWLITGQNGDDEWVEVVALTETARDLTLAKLKEEADRDNSGAVFSFKEIETV